MVIKHAAAILVDDSLVRIVAFVARGELLLNEARRWLQLVTHRHALTLLSSHLILGRNALVQVGDVLVQKVVRQGHLIFALLARQGRVLCLR